MPIIAEISATEGPTFDELVTEIVTAAQGFAVAPDEVLSLEADITAGATTFVAAGARGAGVYEIDSELVYVKSVDPESGTATVHPNGRGWLGTTAAAHTAGAVVTPNPTFPRSRIGNRINAVLSELYPALAGIAAYSGTKDGDRVALPADAEQVLDVRLYGYDNEWHRVRAWEAEIEDPSAASGYVVRLPTIDDGRTVRVVFATRPQLFSTDDQRWSETGLPLSVKDALISGVLAKLVRYIDVGRLTDRYATPRGDTQQPQLGAGVQIARELEKDFQRALQNEVTAQRRRYPIRQHFTR